MRLIENECSVNEYKENLNHQEEKIKILEYEKFEILQ